jgi:hypothetical protein
MMFALTWACVAWVYPPEIFSMNMRGRATSMTTATNWFIVGPQKLTFILNPNGCVELLVRSVHTYGHE